MTSRRSSGKSTKKRHGDTHSDNRQSTGTQSMGGREFGQVIEPMQAQMASGNEGLAEASGEREQPKRKRKAA